MAARTRRPAISPEPSDPLPRILLVDDYPDSLDLYREILATKGFAADTATDGAQAVERAAASCPDVIVMDLFMPLMDGWEATRRIRQIDGLGEVPVIALTANPGALEKTDPFVEVLRKPCPPNVLIRALERALGRAGTGNCSGPIEITRT